MSSFNDNDFEDFEAYEMDTTAAAEAERGRMDTTGAYVCKITKAESTVSEGKGTRGMVIGVQASTGDEAEFTLWTKKADGTPIFGFNQLQAIMMLTGVKGLTGRKGTVSRWDSVAGQRIDMPGVTYPELVGKKVGLMMQKEHYTKNAGGDGFRMNMVGAYHPETMHTCAEMKANVARADKAAKMIEKLKDKDSRIVTSKPSYTESTDIDGGF